MKIYCIAGEPSGDLHQGNLIKALKQSLQNPEFRGLGGAKSEAQGLSLFKHFSEVAYMGLQEVLLNLKTIKRMMREVKADLEAFEPDLILLTDFSGFNLRIAKHAKSLGLPVYYYIAPKVWAWNQSRVKKIRAYVDRVFCILPFEEAFFAEHGVKAHFVGNPLTDAIADFKAKQSNLPAVLQQEKIIALLPGSRKQEVENNLELMAKVKAHFPDHTFVVGAVPFLPEAMYTEVCQRYGLEKVVDQTYELLSQAEAAVVCSGTATLETGLFQVPQVVGYRTSFLTALVFKFLITIPYVSLINLVLQRESAKELLQYAFNEKNTVRELKAIAEGGEKRQAQLNDCQELLELIGTESASRKAAETIVQSLKKDGLL